jgi:hypothetical protein
MARRRYLKLDIIEPNTFKGGANIVLKHNTGDTRYRWVLTRKDISWLTHALETFKGQEPNEDGPEYCNEPSKHGSLCTCGLDLSDTDPWEGYRGPSAMTDSEREANVNEILEFEKSTPETQAEFVNRLTDEMTAAIQDPNKGRK